MGHTKHPSLAEVDAFLAQSLAQAFLDVVVDSFASFLVPQHARQVSTAHGLRKTADENEKITKFSRKHALFLRLLA